MRGETYPDEIRHDGSGIHLGMGFGWKGIGIPETWDWLLDG